jgi:geranylgeranyl pyrophosphate synthase
VPHPAGLEDAVRDLAAAVETLHAATLVHDDLVDGALLRRGQPTLNTRWSAGATVLAGDWLFARAARFAAATRNVDVVEIFARELGTLTDGELRQLFGRAAVPTLADYEYRIYAKTASLFEAATEATAALLGLGQTQREMAARYGRELGMAFQIVDDILDFTADEAKLGKPVGHDLRSGTVTLPALRHFAAHPEAGAWLRDGSGPPDGAVDALVQAIRSDDAAIDSAWAAARDHVAAACAALEAFPPGPAREDLARIAWYAVERKY